MTYNAEANEALRDNPRWVPFNPIDLTLDDDRDDEPSSVADSWSTDECIDKLQEIMGYRYAINTPDAPVLTLEAALALFHELCDNPVHADATRTQLFAACLDTAMIWCHG